jgi:hypothetical protein
MFFAAVGLSKKAQEERPDYPWPQASELWLAGASAIGFFILK